MTGQHPLQPFQFGGLDASGRLSRDCRVESNQEPVAQHVASVQYVPGGCEGPVQFTPLVVIARQAGERPARHMPVQQIQQARIGFRRGFFRQVAG